MRNGSASFYQICSTAKGKFRNRYVTWPRTFSTNRILQSLVKAEHFYTGLTEDLQSRLKKHNNGEVPYTSTFRPWKIKTAIAFTDKERAVQFERYLKTASGRAFAKKRL